MLAVRTVGSVSFLQVKNLVSRAADMMEVAPVITIQRSDIGDRHPLDMSISPVDATAGFVANEVGDIFRCGISEGQSIM